MKIADRMIYIPVIAHQDGPFLPEQNVADLDRTTVVNEIATGEYEGLLQVLECNPVEGTCRDVTDDIAGDICERWVDEGQPLKDWQFEFVEAHRGFAAANSFRRAA